MFTHNGIACLKAAWDFWSGGRKKITSKRGTRDWKAEIFHEHDRDDGAGIWQGSEISQNTNFDCFCGHLDLEEMVDEKGVHQVQRKPGEAELHGTCIDGQP